MGKISYDKGAFGSAVSNAQSSLSGLENAKAVRVSIKTTNIEPFNQVEHILTELSHLVSNFSSAAYQNYNKMQAVGNQIEEDDRGLSNAIKNNVRFP